MSSIYSLWLRSCAGINNYDTLLDYNFDIKDYLEFYWKDGRGSFSAYDVPWLDRKTLSATVVIILNSSNYDPKKVKDIIESYNYEVI